MKKQLFYFLIVMLSLHSCKTQNRNDALIEMEEKSEHLSHKDEWTWNSYKPLNIWHFPKLHDNVYESFDSAFSSPLEVEILYINDKSIRSIPAKISELKNLKELSLNISSTNISKDIGLLGSLEKLERLRISNLKEFPTEIYLLKGLVALEARGTYSSLPRALCELVDLKYARFYNSRSLKLLPECIGNLVRLEYFDFAGTNVEQIPSSIGNCLNIRTIVANACKIDSLPKSIGNLKKLSHLNLTSNKIEEIPKEFGNLQSLKELSLSSNKLTELPNSFKNLEALFSIHINGNS